MATQISNSPQEEGGIFNSIVAHALDVGAALWITFWSSVFGSVFGAILFGVLFWLLGLLFNSQIPIVESSGLQIAGSLFRELSFNEGIQAGVAFGSIFGGLYAIIRWGNRPD